MKDSEAKSIIIEYLKAKGEGIQNFSAMYRELEKHKFDIHKICQQLASDGLINWGEYGDSIELTEEGQTLFLINGLSHQDILNQQRAEQEEEIKLKMIEKETKINQHRLSKAWWVPLVISVINIIWIIPYSLYRDSIANVKIEKIERQIDSLKQIYEQTDTINR